LLGESCIFKHRIPGECSSVVSTIQLGTPKFDTSASWRQILLPPEKHDLIRDIRGSLLLKWLMLPSVASVLAKTYAQVFISYGEVSWSLRIA
jgi:hypothetical protein